MKQMNCIHGVWGPSMLAVLFAFLLCGTGIAEEPEPPPKFRTLFNGTDHSGWKAVPPVRVVPSSGEKRVMPLDVEQANFSSQWTVENGEWVSTGNGPYASTIEEFGDFELWVEFKTFPGADGGIYIRGIPEVQIGDSDLPRTHGRPVDRPAYGSGGLIHNTPATLGRDPLFIRDTPYGEWNTLRIKQVGTRIWVTLNSFEVVMGAELENSLDSDAPLPERGPIILQAEGGEIRWRNIFIREIEEDESKALLQKKSPWPEPTEFDVSYGPHFKQVLHFWKAESEKPTPVLYFVHGGGWAIGHRLMGLKNLLNVMLGNGVSVVSVGYRFIDEATAEGVFPPVKAPMEDAARALQLVRSKAAEWNIDKERIGAVGGSAGACTSLWLAFHPDMADPDSDDPVARESTRLWCAAVKGAQTTVDPKQMKEWTPNSSYGGHAFGVKHFDEFLAQREQLLPWINKFSPYALLTPDDPPVFLSYWTAPAIGEIQKDPTHTANFGVKLKERLDALGIMNELVYPGATNLTHQSDAMFLLDTLTR